MSVEVTYLNRESPVNSLSVEDLATTSAKAVFSNVLKRLPVPTLFQEKPKEDLVSVTCLQQLWLSVTGMHICTHT